MVFKRREKKVTEEELKFIALQKKSTEDLFNKAIELFEQDPTAKLVYFAPFQSWETRLYLTKLFKENLINKEYMKELCKENDLNFSINMEIEGDYPTIYFVRVLKEDKKLKKLK